MARKQEEDRRKLSRNRKSFTAVTVSVDYGDILSVTLPMNQVMFDRIIVVTTKRDEETIDVCKEHGVECLVTNVFYENGAAFNKGAAIERAFEFAGRQGWFCHVDADVILPDSAAVAVDSLIPGNLYTPERYIATDMRIALRDDFEHVSWDDNFSLRVGEEFAGYCQYFHSSDPAIRDLPWYPTNWKHAGGSDSEFWKKWPKSNRLRPPFRVLHLGEDGVNWAGRVTRRLDGTDPPDANRHAELMRQFIEKRELISARGHRHDHEKLGTGE